MTTNDSERSEQMTMNDCNLLRLYWACRSAKYNISKYI